MPQSVQAPNPLPGDHDQRQLVVGELDTTMLVEAAAGTGKTTCMIDRMVGLLREGKCLVENMAAVTFTRKAAAELRARFQVALERAAKASDGEAHDRLKNALARIDRCFIGTIHSFCARLLRERPVEAGVDLAFEELDEPSDARLRQEAWDLYVATLFARDDPILAELDELGVTGLITNADTILAELNELGLDVEQLVGMFMQFASFPDVEEWPAERTDLPALPPLLTVVEGYLEHMVRLAPTFPTDRGNDELMDTYERLPRLFRHVNRHRIADVMNFLAQFRRSVNAVQKVWPGGKQQGKAERDRWRDFGTNTAEPALNRWLERRYEAIIRIMRPAVEVYDRLRQRARGLNFQDLLLRAAVLLRDKPAVRHYFRERFTHLLVDEFQDTDPIQAEVMLLLTADDSNEIRWQHCRPVPGSLFLVGDPKQSIYRFRRADIVTYNQVKDIITHHGGKVFPLTANFRSRRDLVEWCNGTFQTIFPSAANKYAPADCPMLVGRSDECEGELVGIKTLLVPPPHGNNAQVIEFEADVVARTIRHCLNAQVTIPRTRKEIEQGVPPHATPADFLIVTWLKKHLAAFARRLQELAIPHQVTGSSALGTMGEASLLSDCLAALMEPDDPVAMVAVLRGELFGISDPDLYAFKHAGGRFDFRSKNAAGEENDRAHGLIQKTFDRLQRYARWLRQLPPVPAFERIAGDLGLIMRAAARVGGNEQAGSLAKIFEILRSNQSQLHSPADLARLLKDLIENDSEFDSVPARPHETSAVRLMNLHKVKGLQAPVVFLAAAAGQFDHPISLHIDRSGDRVRGYAAINGPRKGWGPAPVLARPHGWDQFAAEESLFVDAEKQRLRYVAATRAGTQLVVVQRAVRNDYNPWQSFEQYLQGLPTLADPGPASVQGGSATRIDPSAVNDAVTAVADCWQVAQTASYAKAAAKAIAVKHSIRAKELSSGEHGTEWGSVIHLLLEAAMRRPDDDLHNLAYVALAEAGLEVSLADTAVDTVKSVMRSTIWKRAQASSKCLVEVPFEIVKDVAGKPTLVRGVIDLVFIEPQGWVIVDYKTDAVSAENANELIEHYRGQVNLYAEVWEQMVAPVYELGLYFTGLGQYVHVAI